MGLPHVVSFCWCLGLETGTKIVAYLHLVISISMVIVCSVFAVRFSEQVDTVEDAGDQLYTTWHRITTAVAIVSTAHVLLAITLIYGVTSRRPLALRVWVWVMCLLWASAVIFNIVESALYGVGEEMFLALLGGVLFFGFLAYCILCVNSFYLMVKSTEDMEGPNRTPY